MKFKTRKFEGLEYEIHIDTIQYHTKNYLPGDFDTYLYIETPENCFGYTDTLSLYKLWPGQKCNYAIDGYYLVNRWRKTPVWIKKELMKTLKIYGLLDDKKRKDVYIKTYNERKKRRLEKLDRELQEIV